MMQFLLSATLYPIVQRIRKWVWNLEMKLVSTIEQ